MTPEKLDEARAKEAVRIWSSQPVAAVRLDAPAAIAARLAREGWTPPEPVDPDVLAFREWVTTIYASPSKRILANRGDYDNDPEAQAYLAGARMAREQERERAKVLVEFIGRVRPGFFNNLDHANHEARKVLAKYRGEA